MDTDMRSITWKMRKQLDQRAKLCYRYIEHPTAGMSKKQLDMLHASNILEINVALKNAIDEAMVFLEQSRESRRGSKDIRLAHHAR